MKRFAKAWDWIANSGNFDGALRLALADGSPYARFMALSEAVHAAAGPEASRHGVALSRLVAFVFDHFVGARGIDPRAAAATVFDDYRRGGRSDVPPILRPHLPADAAAAPRGAARAPIRPGLERQDRRR
jgi:hypothetical protein